MYPGGYEPVPVVTRSQILTVGFLLVLIAHIWPPLILLVAYVVSFLVPYSFRTNDDATSRRRLFHEYRSSSGIRVEDEDVLVDENYWVNQRGMCLFTATMVPRDQEVKAVVCFCHGYTDHTSLHIRKEYSRFVREGVAVVTIDYEGHGRSDGHLGLVYDWDLLIDDTTTFFQHITSEKFPGKKVFLMGESMGGAVVFSTYQRNPDLFSGVVFVSPMCKISEDMLPPRWVIDMLYKIVGPRGTYSALGCLPIAPQKGDLRQYSFRLSHKGEQVAQCPTNFVRNPRLVTARELLDVTSHISNNLDTFDAPFLVQHGKDDRVTDPSLSQALYDESKSQDKTIKLYDDMWHCITTGEADEDIDLVFKDSVSWVLERV